MFTDLSLRTDHPNSAGENSQCAHLTEFGLLNRSAFVSTRNYGLLGSRPPEGAALRNLPDAGAEFLNGKNILEHLGNGALHV